MSVQLVGKRKHLAKEKMTQGGRIASCGMKNMPDKKKFT